MKALAVKEYGATNIVAPLAARDGGPGILPLPLIELDQQQIDSIAQTVPGGARNVQDIYPLTPLQEGMLFHHMSDQLGDTYVLSSLLELQSRADLDALINALQKVIERHDILRTAILWKSLSQPVQVVYRQASLPVENLNCSSEPMEQLNARMASRRQKWVLGRAPLVRLHVAADAASTKWYALLQIHHLVCDHDSSRIVAEEVVEQLTGRVQQDSKPVAYRTYVAQVLKGANVQDSGAFFRSKLFQVEEPTFPFGLQPAPDMLREEIRQVLEPALARQLRAQALRLGVSAARLFHAVWALVVSRTSGRDDVVFGTVLRVAPHKTVDKQQILGMFINTLPLRLQLKGVTVRELVEQTQRELLEILSFTQVSLAAVQRCSGIKGGGPLFGALLNYRRSMENPWAGAAGIRVVAEGEASTSYPITLVVDDLGEDFSLTVQTDGRVDPSRITAYVCTAIRSLLDALDHAPQTPALALSVLPESERYQLVELFNATRMAYPKGKLVHAFFEEQVRRTPEAVAVTFGEHRLLYVELNGRANQLARYLRKKGVAPDQLVGICIDRGLDLVVGLLGILKAGGAYVPLDPNYPTARLGYILGDASPSVVLTQTQRNMALPTREAQVIYLDGVADEIASESVNSLQATEVGLSPQHLAYVIYTSGSTGAPKGVMVQHGNLSNLVLWHCDSFSVGEGSLCSSVAAMGFDAAGWEIWPPLTVGATLALAPQEVTKDVAALLAWWTSQRLDVSFLPTPVAEVAFSQCIHNPTLSTLLVGGDRLRFRPASNSFSLINNYGPTETTVVSTSSCIRDGDGTPHIGAPIANTQIYILDGQQQLVPIGVAGEIYIGGEGVARGYLNRVKLTASKFVPDPFSSNQHARLYKTGDVGRWRADGTIEYLGRNDHQIKLRGYRIELGEIEVQLAGHALVKQAVVVAREDSPGERQLVAYIVARGPDEGGSMATLLSEHLRRYLPEHMVPAAYVLLPALPLTPHGKLDRQALPLPSRLAYSTRSYEAPKGEVETALAGIWIEVLGLERVSRHDNFFEVGGHSLLAMRVLERMRQKGLQVEVQALFRTPTLVQLAEITEEISEVVL